MKWPLSLTIIRHGQSAYNILRDKKKADPQYQEFLWEFKRSPHAGRTRALAEQIKLKYGAKKSDYKTPLTKVGQKQASAVGAKILDHIEKPDVIFVSPYLRTRETLRHMMSGNDSLKNCLVVEEDRIREQEHGLQLIYGDWRAFQSLNPDQKKLYEVQGPYWYQHPQGESVSMVRERLRSVMTMLIREYAGANVWLVSHHLTKLSIRANLERLSPRQFIQLDNNEKPINCGVTAYEGNPRVGKDGRLELKEYNLKLY